MGSMKLDKELVVAWSEHQARKSHACRVSGLGPSGRRYLRVKTNTRWGPGEKIETHKGSTPGCPARDQGKGHLHFQAKEMMLLLVRCHRQRVLLLQKDPRPGVPWTAEFPETRTCLF